jgi:hypothetical protein
MEGAPFSKYCQTTNLVPNKALDGKVVAGYQQQLLAESSQFFNSEAFFSCGPNIALIRTRKSHRDAWKIPVIVQICLKFTSKYSKKV